MNLDFENKDSRQYRFPRQCPGFIPERDSPGGAWFLVGAVIVIVLLALVIS